MSPWILLYQGELNEPILSFQFKSHVWSVAWEKFHCQIVFSLSLAIIKVPPLFSSALPPTREIKSLKSCLGPVWNAESWCPCGILRSSYFFVALDVSRSCWMTRYRLWEVGRGPRAIQVWLELTSMLSGVIFKEKNTKRSSVIFLFLLVC